MFYVVEELNGKDELKIFANIGKILKIRRFIDFLACLIKTVYKTCFFILI